MRYLTFALAKGRLAKKTLAMFEQMGITCEEAKDPDTRKLIFTNEEHKIRFFLSKGIGCTNLCGVWCCGYRRGWKGYDHGGRP